MTDEEMNIHDVKELYNSIATRTTQDMLELYAVCVELYDLIAARTTLEMKGQTDTEKYKECVAKIAKKSKQESQLADKITYEPFAPQRVIQYMIDFLDDFESMEFSAANDLSIGAAIATKLSRNDASIIRMRNSVYLSEVKRSQDQRDTMIYEHYQYDKKRNKVLLSMIDECIEGEDDICIKDELYQRRNQIIYLDHDAEEMEATPDDDIIKKCEIMRSNNIGTVIPALISDDSDKITTKLSELYYRAGFAQLGEKSRQCNISALTSTCDMANALFSISGKEQYDISELINLSLQDIKRYKNPEMQIK